MVFSSWIEDLTYDYENKSVIMTLLNGRQYTIEDVPEEIYQEWLSAYSKGKFWHSDIKGIYT